MLYLDDPLIVFTDLDGSLLDHHDYSWTPAQAWLDQLAEHDIPVIITTSKTSAEVSSLQHALQLNHLPFIAENGALIHLPDENNVAHHLIGTDYAHIREVLVDLRKRYDFEFRGFGDVQPQQVSDWTGLSLADAKRAMQRNASEPLIWFGSSLDLSRMEKMLAQEGLAMTRGGRFWHVMGKDAGKGAAVRWLSEQYPQRRGKPAITLGLGDGPNDISMLEAVDFAVVIRGHHSLDIPLTKEEEKVFRTTLYGPEGWRQGLDHFIAVK
ncbi:mannosyl-3-phosphoglycerate phosphatase-related protein [Ewingella americana]|uniref:Mannosyl-3-phosphoglycerate phosphatase-related protein n=1 Tax=Ewingella americana TaxID=41202 RepID=A0A502GD81_9GAMM|nr:mannosyl-3-phosphoglycerate phosphatase-related protein [Ewingella americana]TPG59280.1 mannosyl-3-phosphoglycerate phosphatase-related protein [Ewingella americana]